MLGWNAGTEQEIFSMEELIQQFSIERVHKGGAKFDFEKAKWFNHQYLQRKSDKELAVLAKPYITAHGVSMDDSYLEKIVALIKERCTLLPDFWEQGHFFFTTPEIKDLAVVQEKWNEQKKAFFESWIASFSTIEWSHDVLETSFNDGLTVHGLKKGDVLLPLRIMLVGGKYGPGVFAIAELIGMEETAMRVGEAIKKLS